MLPVIIRTQIAQPPGLSQRKARAFLREAHRAMGETWQKDVLPQRFMPGARYPHRPRSAKYLKQKENAARRGVAIFGGTVVNVYTGRMMLKLLAGGMVRAFPTRVSITKSGTRYIDMRVYSTNARGMTTQPDKWNELATLKRSENKLLSRSFRDTYEKQVKANNTRIDHKPG